MLLRNEAKVGLLVFTAIVALIAMYWFLRGYTLGASSYPVYAIFSDVRKLDKGADVRMAGVKVGQVSNIMLTSASQARVDMSIWGGTCIPVDSQASVTMGAFIGDNYVEIIPGHRRECLKANMRIISKEPMNYDKLIKDVGQLVSQLQLAAAGLNSVLANKQTLAQLRDAIKQIDLAARSANGIILSAQAILDESSPEVKKALANVSRATGDVADIAARLNKFVKDDAQPNAGAILAQAKEAMANLNDSIVQVKGMLTDLDARASGYGDKIDSALTKVDASMKQAQEMMGNLNTASANVKEITSDPEVKANIKATIKNAADATAQANALLCSLNRRFGGAGSAATRKAAVPECGFTTASLWNTTQGTYRFDANYTLAGLDSSFYRLGAFNVGETTRANLQAGRILTDATALRFGIYASRVGFGLDQRIGNCFLLSCDGFRPNDPQYDLRGILTLGSGFGLYGGWGNALSGKPDVFAGIHYSH